TTTTAVTASANPAVSGQTVTFTATVTPGSGTFDNGGTVQFAVNGTNFGSPVTLSNGQATITDSALTAGTYTITATYSGDTIYASSNNSSSPLTETVNAASTTTMLISSLNPAPLGQSVTFTATVAAVSPGAGVPTGTVTFVDGSTTLGTGALTSGVATFTTSTLSVGSHTITASYPGDTNFIASNDSSNPLTESIGE
ncbi:MAG: Ig-like domain-containing protein, partial [Thermoguttaceae bacterium]